MQKVLVSFRFFDEWIKFLKDNGLDVKAWDSPVPPSKTWIKENIRDADGLLCSLVNRVDREVIDAAGKLKVISTFSVGYDNIDVNYAKSKKIRIGYTPEVLTDATADLIFGLMLAAARRIVEGDKLIRSGKWNQPWTPDFMLGTEVSGYSCPEVVCYVRGELPSSHRPSYKKSLRFVFFGELGKDLAVKRRIICTKLFIVHINYLVRSVLSKVFNQSFDLIAYNYSYELASQLVCNFPSFAKYLKAWLKYLPLIGFDVNPDIFMLSGVYRVPVRTDRRSAHLYHLLLF